MSCRFITIEGIDGSGKSSVAESVFGTLQDRGVDIVLTTEPTRTWLGDAVKRSYTEPVSPFTEAFLFLADRATHTEQIRKWIGEGKLVLSDRYCDSTYAYQGARLAGLQGNAMSWLRRISAPFVMEPDLTLLLDVDPSLGLERIASRARKVHFEREEFLKEVRKNYLLLAKSKRFVVIDASVSLEEVTSEALQIISSRLSVSDPRRKKR